MNNVKKQPLIRFRFCGSSIHDGRILYDDLSTFVSNISSAIERIIKSIQTGENIKRGRPTKATEFLSALEIVSIRKGSFGLGLDLRRNGEQFPGWDLGEQAVDILMLTLKAIEKGDQLPKESNQTVVVALRDAGRVYERGIENVYINANTHFGRKRVQYSQPLREKIVTYVNRYESSYAIVEGRLLEIDTEEDKLHCRIKPSTGDYITCKYDEDITSQLIKYVREFVQIRGEATYDPINNKINTLYIKDIEPISELSGEGIKVSPSPLFWKGKGFEELANEQGVYPIDDLNKLMKDWPEDTDFDSFFEAVRSSRN
jgi:hypothetical protein